MVYLHFPSGLTEEESMLQTKYEKLKRKKKAVQNLKAPRPEPERLGQAKRGHNEARDAREVARKLIKSGAIAAIQKAPRREEQSGFKRPCGLEKKLERLENSRPGGYQPFSATQPDDFDHEPRPRNKKLYETPATVHREREEQKVEKLKETPKEGNTIFVNGHQITEDFLRNTFSSCGKILDISMEIEKNRGFVTFEKKESAARAISEFGSSMVQKVHLMVTYARHQRVVDSVPWTSAASNNSQKGNQKESRELLDYSENPFD